MNWMRRGIDETSFAPDRRIEAKAGGVEFMHVGAQRVFTVRGPVGAHRIA